ncbi:MAG: hypothetical protein ACOC0J_02125 [Myxococcota bacterium]
MKTIIENLPVTLTQEERISKGKALAAVLREVAETEEAAKDAAAEFRGKVKGLKVKAGALATEVDTGKESRPVECCWHPNLEAKTMELYREDTGEFVRSRPMEYEDKQEHLPGFNVEDLDDARQKRGAH